MTSIRPIVLLLAAFGATAFAQAADFPPPPQAAPLSTPAVVGAPETPQAPVALSDDDHATNAQGAIAPTAKVVQTSRKKRSTKTASPAPVLETFPENVQAQQPLPGIERVIYDRAPLRVVLAAGRERRIYLPWEAALHLPPEASELQAQVVGATIYLTGQKGSPIVRIMAEGLDGQGMIPLDVQVRDQIAGVPDEMEISVATRGRDSRANGRVASRRNRVDDEDDDEEPAAPDLVQLTRYCSQQLYAPQRLIKTPPGVRAVDLRSKPVAGLYRGGAVMTTPIGAWRSSTLFVTAVRFTNRSHAPIELDMDMLRGHWVAATPQHHVLAPAGDDADTTAVCLISEQSFDASRP